MTKDTPKPPETETGATAPPPEKRSRKKKRVGASRIRQGFTTLRQNIFLATMAGILAFAGAVAGSMLTNSVQRTIWEEQTRYDSRQHLALKRIELMEKTVELMNKSYAVQAMERDNLRQALTSLGRVAADPTTILQEITKKFQEQTLAKCRFLESHSEYRSILSLDAIFFGEQTRQVVEDLLSIDPWWEADSTLKVELIAAMTVEIASDYAAD